MVSSSGRRIVTMAIAALLVTGAVVAVTGGPAAAAGCSRSACTGHDPYIEGCTKGSHKSTSVSYQGATVANITNWYSANCVANWAEGSLTSAGVNMHLFVTLQAFNPGVTIYMCYYNVSQSNKGDSQESCEYPYYNQSVNAWTDMIDGSGEICVQATVWVQDGSLYDAVASSPSDAACQ